MEERSDSCERMWWNREQETMHFAILFLLLSVRSLILDGVYEILLGSPESAAPDISYINL